MTPQEEKDFFEKLEKGYTWDTSVQGPNVEATILQQEDFEYIIDTLGTCIQQSAERDALLKIIKRSHADLFRLFMDLRAITEGNGEDLTSL